MPQPRVRRVRPESDVIDKEWTPVSHPHPSLPGWSARLCTLSDSLCHNPFLQRLLRVDSRTMISNVSTFSSAHQIVSKMKRRTRKDIEYRLWANGTGKCIACTYLSSSRIPMSGSNKIPSRALGYCDFLFILFPHRLPLPLSIKKTRQLKAGEWKPVVASSSSKPYTSCHSWWSLSQCKIISGYNRITFISAIMSVNLKRLSLESPPRLRTL